MHNFLKKIAEVYQEKNPPNFCNVTIAHDDWCKFLSDAGECNCDPDIVVKKIGGVAA